MAFKYSDYSRMLEYFLFKNYVSTLDWFSFPGKHSLVLRHDIDIIPELCFPLADIEEMYDCRSTWFFLEANGIYSVYDSYTTEIVNELRARGHSVQLHLDCSSATSLDQLVSLVNVAVQRWSDHFGYQPTCFSFHRPAAFNLIPKTVDYRWHNQLRCAYDGDIFLHASYLSDSNRRVIEISDIEAATKDKKPLQLLIHPLWWSDCELDKVEVKERVNDLVKIRCNNLLKNNITLFRS